MISDPAYLSWLRSRYRAQDVLNLLHISSIGIGWQMLTGLAEDFATHRTNINHSMLRLRKAGLIEYESRRAGGTLLWWFKRSEDDRPVPRNDFPRWVLKNIKTGAKKEVLLNSEDNFAAQMFVSPKAVRNFLSGRTKIIQDRYKLVMTPSEWLEERRDRFCSN